jgi:hypothetical protein
MGPTDHEKATQYIETKRNEAFFPRMWVIPCECVRILKYRRRVGKVDSVVLPIDFCLRWIPLEGHPRSVCTAVPVQLREFRSRHPEFFVRACGRIRA